MSEFQTALRALTAPWLRMDDSQLAVLDEHSQLLARWNQKMNLTRVDSAAAVSRHYAESLFAGQLIRDRFGTPLRIVDIGSGAGFPGLVLAVLEASWTVTLLEIDQRKYAFLKEASRGIRNVTVRNQRFEHQDVAYDLAISRAVRLKAAQCLKLAPHFVLFGGEGGAPFPWDPKHGVFIDDVPRETLR